MLNPENYNKEKDMNIEDGWRFMSADFSIQAAERNGNAVGYVMLVRSPDEKDNWFKLPEELKEDDNGPELYVTGRGITLEEAIVNANMAAAHAKPISI